MVKNTLFINYSCDSTLFSQRKKQTIFYYYCISRIWLSKKLEEEEIENILFTSIRNSKCIKFSVFEINLLD